MRDEYCLDGEMIRGPRAKALISSPADGAVLRDRVVRASGIAWAGEAEVTRVEVSVDGGESWHDAQLAAYGGRGAWRRWDLDLEVPAGVSGAVTVLARATDDRGRTQPARGEWNPLGLPVGRLGSDHCGPTVIPPSALGGRRRRAGAAGGSAFGISSFVNRGSFSSRIASS